MKNILTLCTILFLCFSANAQNGCGSSLSSTPPITGPDSTQTDRDQTFRSLIVNPYNENHVLVGSEGNGIFTTRDGGQTWQWVREGLKHFTDFEYAETWSMAFDPSDTSVIFAATTNSPGPITGAYSSAMAGVYKSTDGGKTWSQRNCGLTNSKISGIWCDSGMVVISVSGEEPSFTNPPLPFYTGGLYYSQDKGDNWTKATTDVNIDSVGSWKILERNNVLYTVGITREQDKCTGFLKSNDKGKTWHSLPVPLSKRIISDFSISGDGSKIVALVRDSFCVYVSENEGVSWNRLSMDINGTISINPNDSSTIFVSDWSNLKKTTVGLGSGNVYSGDYHQVLTQDMFIEKLVFCPSNPNTIYLSTQGYKVYKSTDGGESFTELVRLRDVMRASGVITSVKNIPNGEFSLFPNPSHSGIFNINKPVKDKEVKVFDLVTGKLVFHNTAFSGNQLNLSHLENGVYNVEINNSSQKIVLNK